jgi:hypothetical protein
MINTTGKTTAWQPEKRQGEMRREYGKEIRKCFKDCETRAAQ